jgi:hypothetical protein
MTSRALLSRINAKAEPIKKVVVAKKSTSVPIGPKSGTLVQTDALTGKEIKKFKSIDEAVKKGFSKPNLVQAIKNGRKYKGSLWTEIS